VNFMKKKLTYILVVLAWIATTHRSSAQTLNVLHTFTPLLNGTNTDGAVPNGSLILSSNILYGTTAAGGKWGAGTIFRVNTDGTGFMNLHSFNPVSDGAAPNGGLVLSGNTLYGTDNGGSYTDPIYQSPDGTVFSVNTDGTAFRILHTFAAQSAGYLDGFNPNGGLVLSGNTLYGTTVSGGGLGGGIVFAINTNGLNYTTVHEFGGADIAAYPMGNLVLSGNTMFGTTSWGGPYDAGRAGTVFAFNPTFPI